MGISFGPVPSRRLGRSLGINNIPPKHCTYSCTYCQVGRTSNPSVQRREFYAPEVIFRDVAARVQALRDQGEPIDYLTFVPDGEPTLDLQLAREIELLRPLGIPIAVISNASLLWQSEVRDALAGADWVSVKVDAAAEVTWKAINRPAPQLQHAELVEGMLAFSKSFGGRLVTETMLLRGVNDGEDDLRKTADLVAKVGPEVAYIAVPTRPCAEPSSWPSSPEQVALARGLFSSSVARVELLVEGESGPFGAAGELEDEIVRIAAVHPMTRKELEEYVGRGGANWQLVEALLERGRLREISQLGTIFYFSPAPG
jgi:wyosine [tRNA(Phe)-imidazoG37] synthetase (radical SAM superfamily)